MTASKEDKKELWQEDYVEYNNYGEPAEYRINVPGVGNHRFKSLEPEKFVQKRKVDERHPLDFLNNTITVRAKTIDMNSSMPSTVSYQNSEVGGEPQYDSDGNEIWNDREEIDIEYDEDGNQIIPVNVDKVGNPVPNAVSKTSSKVSSVDEEELKKLRHE